MKSIFEPSTNQILRERVNKLNEKSQSNWGKMNAHQMVKHCILSEEMFLGKKEYKRLFMGRLFGKMVLNKILKNEEPMKKNSPTHPTFKIKSQGLVSGNKEKWIILLKEYLEVNPKSFNGFVHPFFGTMTYEQIGIYVYKHTDHHLRQFSV